MIMNTPLHKITSRALFRFALLTNVATAWLVYLGTHNTWLALATHQLGLMIGALHCSTLMYLDEQQQKAQAAALAAEAADLDHHKVAMPEPRHETGDRFAAPHPRFTTSGHTVPQMLGAVAIVAGAVLTVPALYFILITVMGAQEPRW